jgi:hypothetical protein
VRSLRNQPTYSPVGAAPFNFDPLTLGAISFPIAPGDAGIVQTVRVIRKLVDDGVKDPTVNALAIQIARTVPRFDRMALAQALYEWVLENIWFVDDPVAKETVRPAAVVLRVGGGDCDDINGVLLPSLLGTVGIPSRLVTVASDPRDPSQFSHIYAEADIDGAWMPIDAARPGAQFGLEPSNWARKRWWSLDNDSYEDAASPDHIPGAAESDPSTLFGLNGYVSLARLGQDDATSEELAASTDIAAGTVGIADIIAASKGSPYGSFSSPTSYSQFGIPSSGVAAVPSMGLPAGSVLPGSSVSASLTGMMPWILLLIGGAIAIKAFK